MGQSLHRQGREVDLGPQVQPQGTGAVPDGGARAALARSDQDRGRPRDLVQPRQAEPPAAEAAVQPGHPIYDGTKCAEVGGTGDPWAVQFLKNDSAGFGPYRLKQLVRGQQAVFETRDDYWGAKPAMKRVIMKEVPTSSSRLSLLQGRGDRHRAVPAAPRDPIPEGRRERRRGRRQLVLHDLARAQCRHEALRQRRCQEGLQSRDSAGGDPPHDLLWAGGQTDRADALHLPHGEPGFLRLRSEPRQGEGDAGKGRHAERFLRRHLLQCGRSDAGAHRPP